jgi:hypothetical protein
MYKPVELVIQSYKPLHLEKGMLFLNDNRLWEFKTTNLSEELFLIENGYPFELALIDDDGMIIAEHHQIGWWDVGESSDELRDITLKDINLVFELYDGMLDVESIDYITNTIPRMVHDKVILRLPEEEYYEEDDDDDWYEEEVPERNGED